MAESFDLRTFRWRHRVLLVLPDDDHGELLLGVLRQFAALRREFRDRDLKLVVVLSDGTVRVDKELPTRMDTTALRARLSSQRPAEGGRLFLIGKDGGIKMTAADPVDLQRVFDLIDTMPVRRREMAERHV